MTDSPLVSVVIPTYNRPEFLKKTILSILGQTYTNWELIVVSNGVNKANFDVVQKFDDPRIRYADQKNSGGPSSPRNHGIRLAKGIYVAFCDDDDLWMPSKLEKQVRTLETNPTFGICYTNMKRFDEAKEWVDPNDNGHADLETLLYKNTMPISSIFIRKSLLEQYGGFTESSIIGYSEDYDFVLKYSYYTKIYHIDEFLINYWSGMGRTSSQNNMLGIVHYIKYLKGIVGCYYLQYQAHRISLYKFIFLAMLQVKFFAKIFIYNLLKQLNIVGRHKQ